MMTFAGFVRPKELVLFVLIPLLSACAVEVDPGNSRPPPPRPGAPQAQMCTMEYAPVCGQRSGRRQTFSNACQARSNGFTIIGRGECRPALPITPPKPRPPFERPGGICTREYRPVCARRGSQTRSFPNACEARNSGFGVVGQGECGR